jgi:hypothetical protein
MHGLINVKSPYNISKWQMGFNSAFKGLKKLESKCDALKNNFSLTSNIIIIIINNNNNNNNNSIVSII